MVDNKSNNVTYLCHLVKKRSDIFHQDLGEIFDGTLLWWIRHLSVNWISFFGFLRGLSFQNSHSPPFCVGFGFKVSRVKTSSKPCPAPNQCQCYLFEAIILPYFQCVKVSQFVRHCLPTSKITRNERVQFWRKNKLNLTRNAECRKKLPIGNGWKSWRRKQHQVVCLVAWS